MTHLTEGNHKRNIASNGSTELSRTGGQLEASGCSGVTRLPPGRVHFPPSLLTIIGQNLPIPLERAVSREHHMMA